MDIISKINWVDILIVILVLRISYASSQEGLSHGIFPLIGNAFVLILGLHYYAVVGNLISSHLFNMPIALADFLGFLALVVALGFACKLLNALLVNILKTEWHPLIERWGGCLVGVLKACLIACIVVTILALMPLAYLQRSVRDRSMTGMYALRIGPAMYCKVARFLPSMGRDRLPPSEEILVSELAANKSMDWSAKRKPKAGGVSK